MGTDSASTTLNMKSNYQDFKSSERLRCAAGNPRSPCQRHARHCGGLDSQRDEILGLIAGAPAHDVYNVPRRSYMMGRWIKGSGWYPNFRQPQLFRKGAMRYTLEPVHEGYENLNGKPIGTLKNAIWQFPFRDLDEVIRKMNRYSSLGVPKLAGKRVSMASAFGHGLWSFIKHYVFKRGFVDGWAGFVIAFGNFEGTFYRYAKRYEETQDWQPPPSKPIRRS